MSNYVNIQVEGTDPAVTERLREVMRETILSSVVCGQVLNKCFVAVCFQTYCDHGETEINK